MDAPQVSARRWLLAGHVQGVGFRPFVYRLALRHGLRGWVQNRTGLVEIVAQGAPAALRAFAHDLVHAAPPLARPRILESAPRAPAAYPDFRIVASSAGDVPEIHVPPDYFLCAECLRELRDPLDRRHAYPFLNCTQCGPRYTLIRALPYDRANTTLADFPLCPACLAEYRDPADRRFHAEPVACPACGPRLEWVGNERHAGAAALRACLEALRGGRVVAVKGIGGYHLLCDAAQDQAVAYLRARKPRPHKPLALLVPQRGADDLDALREIVAPSAEEAALLRSPMRPIVLARKKAGAALSELIAPGLNEIGVMLPYSPLHHLLLDGHGGPLVATSANLSGEPVLTDNAEVETRLGHVAEAFLHHDRPIARPADDPVFRSIHRKPRPLRLGRGCAPLELELPFRLSAPLLAVGGHTKNTVALAWEDRAVVSPHIGDLDAPRSLAVFAQVIADLQDLYQVRAARVVCDAHPGYASSRWARRGGLPVSAVLHHHAHASALAGEKPEVRDWLVFTWDGVGYGADGGLWGGEALLGRPGAWRRAARLRPFALPGGEKAGREPWRSAAALCWEAGLEWPGLARVPHADLLRHAWRRGLNCPPTTAAGRLFDAAAALTGLIRDASFEGQGPMLLEAALAGPPGAEHVALPLSRHADGCWESDWAPLLPPLLDAARPVAERAALFHASLAHALLAQAQAVAAEHAVACVGLSGGVFQNRALSEQAIALLEQAGFAVFFPESVPVNDAGISFGQVIEAGYLEA